MYQRDYFHITMHLHVMFAKHSASIFTLRKLNLRTKENAMAFRRKNKQNSSHCDERKY